MSLRTKIIASIGPATESPEMIESLISSGMNIARMNFSHDLHEAHGRRIDDIRKIAKKLKKDVEILCDLQGPKIRIRQFENAPRTVAVDEKITLTTSVCQAIKPGELVIEDPYLHSDVSKGDVILIDDGQIELCVEKVKNHKIHCRVVVGGDIYPRKGVNLPLTQTTTSSITDKDINDLKFVITKNPDWIAISFVQNAEDVNYVRKLVGKHPIRIMCKIERAKALDNLESIINASDGIMVARGDLGVEIPIEKLPIIQKQIIRHCNYANKPVVTATQMMASMTHAPFPTRAEVSDVANAVYDGTDAVMLSNETAVGEYPVKAVQMMAKIINETENFIYHRQNNL